MSNTQFYLTAETKIKLEQKVRELEIKLQETGNEIAEAADHGTWHDNFNYEQSHQKREFVEIQLNDLKDKLRRVEIIKPNLDTSKVSLGHQVTVEINGQQKTYTILGELDSDPVRGFISYPSPLGKSLLGKTVGEIINGLKILAID